MGAFGPLVFEVTETMIQPILDRILVEEIPVVETGLVTASGFKLERSERYAAKPMQGKVLAVGTGVPVAGVLLDMPYQPGDVINCSEYGREYVNLRTGEVGLNRFLPEEAKTFLIRVADTHGKIV